MLEKRAQDNFKPKVGKVPNFIPSIPKFQYSIIPIGNPKAQGMKTQKPCLIL